MPFGRRGQPSLTDLADRARDAGEWAAATTLYRSALARNFRNPPLWVQYGHALKESGELHDPAKLVQAEAAYRRALVYAPRVADTHVQLGHVLKLQGRTDEAKAAYLRALALDPALAAARDELQALGWEEGDGAELKAALASLDGLAPPRRRRPSPIEQADAARDAGQWALAARHYRAVLERRPDDAAIWVQYGHALKEAGNRKDPARLAEAEAAYRRALALQPGTADTHLQLGHVLKLQGKTEEAEAAYLRAFVFDPVQPTPFKELNATGWLQLGSLQFQELFLAVDQEDISLRYRDESSVDTQQSCNDMLFFQNDHDIILNSKLFDREFYLETYPDVAQGPYDPLEHFCRFGWRKHRKPNPHFDTSFYLSKYEDVAAAGINPLVHWILYGKAEGRKIGVEILHPPVTFKTFPPPSVIFLSHDASATGAPVILLSFIRWLKANTTIRFAIVLGRGGSLKNKFEEIAPCFYINDHPQEKLRGRLIEFCGHNVQVIYCNTIASGAYIKDIQFLNALFIAHVHELENLFNVFENEVKELISCRPKFIAVSDDVRACIERRVDVEATTITVIPGFIEPIDRSICSVSCLCSDRRVKIIFGCGTVEKRKGFDLFCEVARLLPTTGSLKIKMYWIGSEGDINAKEEIERTGVSEVVTWLGPQEYPRSFFEQGDLFLLTSREDPFPLVCLEAAESSLPIICFGPPAGGIHTFVEDDAGVVVPYLDVAAMASETLKLLGNSTMRNERGRHAREKVQAKHYVKNIAPQILNLFPALAESTAETECDSYFEQIDRAAVVSFDVFDTLITRKVADPRTAFDVIEYVHTMTEPGAVSMYEERMYTAGVALSSRNGAVEDINVDEIYEMMPFYRNARLEKGIETKLCAPVPLGKRLFEYAVCRQKPIYLTSDMYLDTETMESILTNCGYAGWDKLLLSSQIGKKKATGNLYTQLINEALVRGCGRGDILHIGDDWEADVVRAKTQGIRAIWFNQLGANCSYAVQMSSSRREHLSQVGCIWDGFCTQAYKLWIQEHSDVARDFFIRLGFQMTGPFAAMLAMHARDTAEKRGIKKIVFLARDGRVVKNAFETLFQTDVDLGKYELVYLHLMRSTVIRATLNEQLSSNDLYCLMEGLHLGEKPLSYFIRNSGLDPTSSEIRERAESYFRSIDYVPKWNDRAMLASFFLSLSSKIFEANKMQRRLLDDYIQSSGILEERKILMVDVGWLLNVQTRLNNFIKAKGWKTELVGCYIGSRDGAAKTEDYSALLFRLGEPSFYGNLIRDNTTLFEMLFSAPEAPVEGLIYDDFRSVTLAHKTLDLESTEFAIAQSLHYGARAFFKQMASALIEWFPNTISGEYMGLLFDSFVNDPSREAIAFLSDLAVALGGMHEIVSRSQLINSRTDFQYVYSSPGEKFDPIHFGRNLVPQVIIITSAGLDNGSTRYRALNIGEVLSRSGVGCTVVHSETELDRFGHLLQTARSVIFQRCFEGQGRVAQFYRMARETGKRCVFEIDDLVFPGCIESIGSVLGGEWTLENARTVAGAYEALTLKADECIASTDYIANFISRQYGKRTWVVHNRIGEEFIRHRDIDSGEAKIKMVYASGTRSHRNDFAQIEDLVFRSVANAAHVEFHVLGRAEIGKRLLSIPNVYSHPLLPYREMMALIGEMDVMLIPLEANIFNDAKSCVKFVECGAVGVPVIASKVQGYDRTIRSGQNGWVVEGREDWWNALQRAIQHPEILRMVGRRALDTVSQHYCTSALQGLEDFIKAMSG